jgi:hypothetical protein
MAAIATTKKNNSAFAKRRASTVDWTSFKADSSSLVVNGLELLRGDRIEDMRLP